MAITSGPYWNYAGTGDLLIQFGWGSDMPDPPYFPQVQVKINGQDWPSDVISVGYGVSTYSTHHFNYSLVFRIRENSVSAWSTEITTDGIIPGTENMPLFPDEISYKQVRDSVISILGVPDAATLGATKLQRLASAITAASTFVLRYHPWPDAIVIQSSVSVTDGLVSLAALQKAIWIEFWTANPGAQSTKSTARRLYQLRNEAAGYYVDTAVATIYVRYIPEPPTFTSTAVVGGTTYAVGDIVYNDTTGHCYVCIVSALGSLVTDVTKFTPIPLLYTLREPIQTFAASVYRRLEQEYDQEKALRESAIMLLEEIKQPLTSPQ
jgi:hypothetical protein